MFDKQKIIKICILSVAIFALLVNIANYFYSDYYVKGHYSGQNYAVRREFEKSIPADIPFDKIDNTPFCIKTKPDSFFPIYYELSLLSGLLAAISLFIIIPFAIIKRRIFSRRYKLAIAVILFITLIIYFEVGLIEVSYDFIGCGRYW